MFLKIGELYINEHHIESVMITDDVAYIYVKSLTLGKLDVYPFRGRYKEAIVAWLTYQADVLVLDVRQEGEEG